MKLEPRFICLIPVGFVAIPENPVSTDPVNDEVWPLIKFDEDSYQVSGSIGSEDSEYDEDQYNRFIFIH